MHMLFSLKFLAMMFLVSLMVSFVMRKELEGKWNALIKSLEERLMRFIHRHDEWLERESNKAREIEERTQKIEKAVTHLLNRIKNLETPPEVRAKNAADSAVDELLNSSW
jgi:N-glycosylase/DNA lyase